MVQGCFGSADVRYSHVRSFRLVLSVYWFSSVKSGFARAKQEYPRTFEKREEEESERLFDVHFAAVLP